MKVLGEFPAPPDHLVMLEQMISPDKAELITPEMRTYHQKKQDAKKYGLGSGIILGCTGGSCRFSDDCDVYQTLSKTSSGPIADKILADTDCVLEIAAAKKIFDSIITTLVQVDQNIDISPVDALNILEVIRKEILVMRLIRHINRKGELYEEVIGFDRGEPMYNTVLNPAFTQLDKLVKSRDINIKALAIDRESQLKQDAISEERHRAFQKLAREAKQSEIVVQARPELGE